MAVVIETEAVAPRLLTRRVTPSAASVCAGSRFLSRVRTRYDVPFCTSVVETMSFGVPA